MGSRGNKPQPFEGREMEEGVWIFECPKCGNWEIEPPAKYVISVNVEEQVYVPARSINSAGWGWVDRDFYERELKPLGYKAKQERVTKRWRVRLASGKIMEITQTELMELWDTLANPTVTSRCIFCNSVLRKRWVPHHP